MSSFAEQNDMTNMAFAFILTNMKALLGFEKTSQPKRNKFIRADDDRKAIESKKRC